MNPYTSGVDVLGAGPGAITNKTTVRSVQEQLHALAQKTGNPAFDPGKADGLVGPHTDAAVAAFNKAFGWPADGSDITQGTLFALKRPDVVDPAGYAAKQAGDAAAAELHAAPHDATADDQALADHEVMNEPPAKKPMAARTKWLLAGGSVLVVAGTALAVGLRR